MNRIFKLSLTVAFAISSALASAQCIGFSNSPTSGTSTPAAGATSAGYFVFPGTYSTWFSIVVGPEYTSHPAQVDRQHFRYPLHQHKQHFYLQHQWQFTDHHLEQNRWIGLYYRPLESCRDLHAKLLRHCPIDRLRPSWRIL
ncbi:MAG: hypothetical protein IPF95_01690 [Flavobacteriales bacterium]|nr:hypothetical protein [Flavobacteriales bacterium]